MAIEERIKAYLGQIMFVNLCLSEELAAARAENVRLAAQLKKVAVTPPSVQEEEHRCGGAT